MKFGKVISSIILVLSIAVFASSLAGCDIAGSGKKKAESKAEKSDDEKENKKKGKRVPEVSSDDFIKAVRNAYDCTSSDLTEKDSSDIYIESLDNMYVYEGNKGYLYYAAHYAFTNEEAAETFYKQRAENYEIYNDIDGSIDTFDDYQFVDAYLEPNYDQEDYYIFGGTYYSGSCVIEIYCFSDEDEDKEAIKDLMKDLELPHPKNSFFD